MPVLRTAIRLISEHRALFVLYVLLFSFIGAFAGGSLGAGTSQYEEAWPVAAVIDRDSSDISRALAAYVADGSEMVEIEDSTAALQEASAKNFANYVLVIPEGYGEDLLEAARSGETAPDLECVVSYMNASGALMDERVRGFAQELYALAAARPTASGAELSGAVMDAQDSGVAVSTVHAQVTGVPLAFLIYCQFSLYALFGGVAVIVGIGLADLRRPEVRQRLGASPVTSTSFDLQTALAIVVCGCVVWAVNAGAGLALYAAELIQVPPALTLLMLAILAALTLVGMAFGFLIWQLGVRSEMVHAISNISAMILSFLAGAWVPLENLTPEVLAVARFTPGYWAVTAMRSLVDATAVSTDLVLGVVGNIGIIALFALAIAAAGLAVGRARRVAA